MTGYIFPSGVRAPSIGSVVARSLGRKEANVPPYIYIGRDIDTSDSEKLFISEYLGPGFYGVNYAPFMIPDPAAGLATLYGAVGGERGAGCASGISVWAVQGMGYAREWEAADGGDEAAGGSADRDIFAGHGCARAAGSDGGVHHERVWQDDRVRAGGGGGAGWIWCGAQGGKARRSEGAGVWGPRGLQVGA